MNRNSLITLSVAAALGICLSLPVQDLQAAEAITVAQAGKARPGQKSRRQHRPNRSRHQSRRTEHKRTENGRESRTTWTGRNGKEAKRDVTVVNDRENGQRTKDVTLTGPDGQQRTLNHRTDKTDTGYTRSSVFTDAEGRQATRDTVVTNDRENGQRTRDVTHVGRDGKTRTSNTQITRTDDGHVRNTVFTDANGDQASRDVVVTRDQENGQHNRDVTYVGRDGQTRTRNTQTNRTDDGYTRSTVATDAQGRQAARDVVVSRDTDAGQRTRDVTYTGRDGEVRTVNDVTTRSETGFDRSTVFTDANGDIATRDASVTRDPENSTRQRDVTFVGRDGQIRTVSDTATRTDEGGFDRNTTYTNAEGNSVTRHASSYWDPETQTWVHEVDYNSNTED